MLLLSRKALRRKKLQPLRLPFIALATLHLAAGGWMLLTPESFDYWVPVTPAFQPFLLMVIGAWFVAIGTGLTAAAADADRHRMVAVIAAVAHGLLALVEGYYAARMVPEPYNAVYWLLAGISGCVTFLFIALLSALRPPLSGEK